jgi:hypothetical protein
MSHLTRAPRSEIGSKANAVRHRRNEARTREHLTEASA